MLKNTTLSIIRWYQRTLSPDHSPHGKRKYPYGFCKFAPTCSEYMYQSVEKYGALRGLGMGTLRIARCNPCKAGGYDPVS